MESTGSRELIKSILIIAGIPLAFSVACSLFARIKEKNISSFQDQIQETKFDGMCGDDEDNTSNANHLKEQIFTLGSKIEELRDLEREIEVRFFQFIDLKDQEYVLMEVQNSLCLEKERAEFLEREVSSMEEENKKFDEMVIEYLKALGELESSRLENSLLRRKEKKLLKKTRDNLRLIREQNLKIEAREVELKRKEIVIGEFQREVEEMRAVISQFQDEKDEVLKRLKTTEKALASKAEAELILMENYDRVVNELENLKKDRAGELKELIYLRWCHACLRHEIARRNVFEQERIPDDEKINHGLRLGSGGNGAPQECKGHESDSESVVHHEEPFVGPNQRHTKKRRWLSRKFKKWVEGNEAS